MSQREPTVLTIAGLDPSGGAGIIADVKTFIAFKCSPVAALTSITFQNTKQVFGVEHQSADTLRAQLEPVLDQFEITAVKTGMLPTAELILAVARLCSDGLLPAPVVDPVLAATAGQLLIEPDAVPVLIEKLFPFARVVTPNIAEAQELTRAKITNEAEMKIAAEQLKFMGARAVLLKGGHLANSSDAIDILLDRRGLFHEFRAPFLEGAQLHGSGCMLSAGITAELAHGRNLVEAVRLAKAFVTEKIRHAAR
ncbi:MAG: bifunctional hydroxymethylpyrimidine kinase/phosphomethylpyrimidine kinase [Pyrinomonadaceae bacterium]